MRKVQKPKPYAHMNKREKSHLKEEITKVNERIARLEKSGLSKSSAAYRYLEGQLAAGANWLRKDRFGNIRVKGNISKMSADKISQVARETEAFKKAKTSTVSGTKQARQAMLDSFNKRLADMGIKQRVTDPDQIRDMYENKTFKKMQSMFYSESVKVYTMATKSRSKRFLTTIMKSAKDIAPDEVYKLLDEHKEYENAVRGILTSKEVQDLMIKEPIYNKMTPDQFREFVTNVGRHTEEDESLIGNVEKQLNEGWY